MQIKMKQAKNVYGVRVPSGKVLTVGTEIPSWQADKFKETGVADDFVAPPSKGKASKRLPRQE